MSASDRPAGQLLSRLSAVSHRLGQLRTVPPPDGLTAPDEPSGEQWEWGQVWAHMAEFIPYWMEQIGGILAADTGRPVPFGRVKTDPERIAAIARDRGRPVPELWERMLVQMDDLRRSIEGLTDEDWEKHGEHSTLGVMEMQRIYDVFVVGHLEQHADQLEGLASAT